MTQTPDSNRLDRIERILDTLATNQVNERDARLAMREDLEILYQTVQLTDRAINELIRNAEADRAAIRELQTEVKGIQTENQRILEFLFGQQGEL
ncbi:hypothetical protein [Argonema antarcticum]|uniref:hypothetical protein n=1 Tax=Argonema antarcticum TaxID=2942763 RepID=UPI00201110D4|nr:hypothetical protein [Argonema antarcticum]MCL1473141.1 hypothetical protein [Argonema antarcticum A004/B2]